MNEARASTPDDIADLQQMESLVCEARAGYGAAPVTHRDLRVYETAFRLAMQIRDISLSLPKSELSMTDQMRRSSRSVATNIAEAWRRRRYQAAFISKLNEVEAEIAETQSWLEFALACEYVKSAQFEALDRAYEDLMGSIVGMIVHSGKWTLKKPEGSR